MIKRRMFGTCVAVVVLTVKGQRPTPASSHAPPAARPGGEALTGVRAGRVLSRESYGPLRGADAVETGGRPHRARTAEAWSVPGEAGPESVHPEGGRAAAVARRPDAGGQDRPACVVEVLNAIYETDSLGFSYGFRPGSQRRRINWLRMRRLVSRLLPSPRICHPYPLVRLGVVTQGGSRTGSTPEHSTRPHRSLRSEAQLRRSCAITELR